MNNGRSIDLYSFIGYIFISNLGFWPELELRNFIN